MKFNAARQSFSLTLLISATLLTIFGMRRFVMQAPAGTPSVAGMPLAARLTDFSLEHPVWGVAAVFLLVIWISYIVIQLTVRYASATSRNYLPIPVFIISACGILIPPQALASYTAAFLLVLATRQFVAAFRKDARFGEMFKAGFYTGFIPLLYAPGAVFLLMIPLLAGLYRRTGRELAVSAIGAAMPLAGAWFILWISGESVRFFFTEFRRSVSEGGGIAAAHLSVMALACAGLIALLALIAAVQYAANRKGMRTRQRKVMAHILLTLLFAILSVPIPGSSASVLPLAAVPASMAIPYAFAGKQAAFSSAVYCLLLLAVLALNLFPLFGILLP